jgi:hypothetical protein
MQNTWGILLLMLTKKQLENERLENVFFGTIGILALILFLVLLLGGYL